MKLSERDCDESVPSAYGSCADACCRVHDRCCGSANRPVCNRAIVACLDRCIAYNPFDGSCQLGVLPVYPGEIKTAMSIVESWCCGSPCSQSELMAFNTSNNASDRV